MGTCLAIQIGLRSINWWTCFQPGRSVKALRVLLHAMLSGRDGAQPSGIDESPDVWTLDANAPVVRSLSVTGIGHGDHDLAEQSQDIPRQELGRPGE